MEIALEQISYFQTFHKEPVSFRSFMDIARNKTFLCGGAMLNFLAC